MSQKVKTDKIPSAPDELYIQLYCEKKGVNDEGTIQRARNSWNSLCNSKKMHFYKTIENKNFLNYAHKLSKSKIYVKSKLTRAQIKKLHSSHVQSNNKELDQHKSLPSVNEIQLLYNSSLPIENNITNELADNRPNCHKTQNDSKLEICEGIDESSEDSNLNRLGESRQSIQLNEDHLETQSNASSHQRAAVTLVEPTPPIVNNGKEFYDMVKQPEDPSWEELSIYELTHYRKLVVTLKRDYIKKYEKYLESLSQQQLFDHYMKTLH